MWRRVREWRRVGEGCRRERERDAVVKIVEEVKRDALTSEWVGGEE